MTLPFGQLLLQAAGPLLFGQFGGATDLKGALHNLVPCASAAQSISDDLGGYLSPAMINTLCTSALDAIANERDRRRSTASCSTTCRSRRRHGLPPRRLAVEADDRLPVGHAEPGQVELELHRLGHHRDGAVDLRRRPHRRRAVSTLATTAHVVARTATADFRSERAAISYNLPSDIPRARTSQFCALTVVARQRQNRTLTHDWNRSRPGCDRHRSSCGRGGGGVVRGFAETTVNGNLADDPLPTLLHQLFAQKATGILRIQNRAGRHDVFLRGGYPVAVTLPGSAELLGKVLFEMGILDEATYKKTLAEPPPPRAALRRHAAGEEAGHRGPDAPGAQGAGAAQAAPPVLPQRRDATSSSPASTTRACSGTSRCASIPARAIYHGVRSAWNAERLQRRALPARRQGHQVHARQRGRGALRRRPRRRPRGRAACARATGRSPDLVEAAGLPPQPVHALVYALYICEALDIKSATEVPRLRKRTDTPLPPNATAASAETVREISGAYKMPSQVTPLPQKPGSHVARCRPTTVGRVQDAVGRLQVPVAAALVVAARARADAAERDRPRPGGARRRQRAQAARSPRRRWSRRRTCSRCSSCRRRRRRTRSSRPTSSPPSATIPIGWCRWGWSRCAATSRRSSAACREAYGTLVRRRAPRRVQGDARQAQGRRRRGARQGDEDARGGDGASVAARCCSRRTTSWAPSTSSSSR